ncbi:MAG: hypothetical protein DLM67_14015 [Candidatus Nephthysia bennettiae]|nr:MAG: hypothetical protein DLM67_14015 [Candidatus Dormibacteraeota bacterium]
MARRHLTDPPSFALGRYAPHLDQLEPSASIWARTPWSAAWSASAPDQEGVVAVRLGVKLGERLDESLPEMGADTEFMSDRLGAACRGMCLDRPPVPDECASPDSGEYADRQQ